MLSLKPLYFIRIAIQHYSLPKVDIFKLPLGGRFPFRAKIFTILVYFNHILIFSVWKQIHYSQFARWSLTAKI
jgi:hypothetical protein